MSYNNVLKQNNSEISKIAEYIQNINAKKKALNSQTIIISPSVSQQLVVVDKEYDAIDSITLLTDEDLQAKNIKLGKTVCSINGYYTGEGYSHAEDKIIDRTIDIYTNDRVATIRNNAFSNCTSLTSVNFPVCTSIGDDAFSNCYNLLSLTLGASKVCTLSNSNAFTSTPIAGYTTSTNGVYGSIFVPASLVDAYKVATNWSYFADRIVAIGDGSGDADEGDSATLITFTIDDTEYQAEEGMTWAEWVESEYNTDGYYVVNAIDSLIFSDDSQFHVKAVLSGDEITSNSDYLLIAQGNGGAAD